MLTKRTVALVVSTLPSWSGDVGVVDMEGELQAPSALLTIRLARRE